MSSNIDNESRTVSRGENNLAEIFFTLSVNFLLYMVLIIVFYMLVRFYLEEETDAKEGYFRVPSNDIDLMDYDDRNEDSIITDSSSASRAPNEKQKKSAVVGEKPIKRSGSFLNVNEWGDFEGTKQEVMQRVLFCGCGLVVSFCVWGLVQERILTQTYDGDFFEYSYGLVFINRLGGLILSTFLMYYFQVKWVPIALWENSFPSVANMLSSWCQYEALKYVSFPMMMLAKAFKMVPIMLMGKLMNNKSYETYEYISGATVGFGLYLFLESSEHIDLRQNVFGDPENVTGAMCGVVLLILFLFFDSFTGQWQTRMFQLNKTMSPIQMMAVMNAFSAVFSFITLIHQEELYKCVEFLTSHPTMGVHLLIFCVCSTVGQLFIYYTVKSFGAVVFAIIMSVRILFSILLSCVVYSHPVQELGFLGILIVFGAISYRIRRKTEGKSLIQWKETEHSKVVFNEWHEHIDI